MKLNRLILTTLILIAVCELIIQMFYFEHIPTQTYLMIQFGIAMISLLLILVLTHSLGKRKLFEFITAITVIMIFVVMFIVVLVLPVILFNWLFLLLIFFFLIVGIHSFLKKQTNIERLKDE